jgi:hypothetical protein
MYEFYNGSMKIAKGRNGIRYPRAIHERARILRAEGKTHREIVGELGISLGTANVWTKGSILLPEQQREIQRRRNQHVMTAEERDKVSQWMKRFWLLRKYTREDLLEKIMKFYKKHGRIPLKREFNSFRVFKNEFGSWNKAIIAAGFDPNPVLFAKKFTAGDGHPCDSFTERIIDDWFFKKHIVHERQWHYGDTKMTADFFIQPNIIVEFFGLAGVQKRYDVILERKRTFCAEQNLRLIEIYPKDIFPVNTLDYGLLNIILPPVE